MPSRPTPRLTRIVATLGPACDEPAVLDAIVRAGLDVARLNLSHGTHAEHAARVARVRAAASRCGVPVAILFDTKGPEVRTAPLAGEPVALAAGDPFVIATDGRLTTRAGTSVTHAGFAREVPVGARVLIDDGEIELAVDAPRDGALACTVARSGVLLGRKGVHVIGARLSLPSLSDADREDLRFAVEQDGDWIAASFVREAGDVEQIRAVVRSHGGAIPVIAKIEHPDAVAGLDAILATADGVMVARGDLGVVLPVGEVPLVQKRLIRAARLLGKPVITATQMLDSMERNARPTRAEASDVVNAIFDGTDAVMLSGETAGGRYPVEAVRTMDALARQAEGALGEYGALQRLTMPHSQSVPEAVAEAAVALAREIGAAAIVCLTESGATARFLSKYRPPCPILAATASARVQRDLSLAWGVTPLVVAAADDRERALEAAAAARERGLLARGDAVVVTAGRAGAPASTDLIRVVAVP